MREIENYEEAIRIVEVTGAASEVSEDVKWI
mgnify:FL=1